MFARIFLPILVLAIFPITGCGSKEPGDPVVAPPQSTSTGAHRIEVTADGFIPSQISVPAGQDTVIEFVRTAETTCATEVVFAKSGERHNLPLNTPVSLTVHPATGEKIQYSCPMDMFHGSVVAADSSSATP